MLNETIARKRTRGKPKNISTEEQIIARGERLGRKYNLTIDYLRYAD